MKAFAIVSLLSLIFLLGGCTENNTPVSSPDNLTQLSKELVPIRLIVEGTSMLNPGNNWAVQFDATHIGSHIGKGTSVGSANLVFTSPTGGNVINGLFVVTAANGDELNLVGGGTFLINGSLTEYDLNFNFEGGTGRFANATGTCHGIGIGEPIDPANPLIKTLHLEGIGRIQF